MHTVARAIIKHYGGSIKNVQMCVGSTWTREGVITDLNKSLKECSIATANEHPICYDFDFISSPMLSIPFGYKVPGLV